MRESVASWHHIHFTLHTDNGNWIRFIPTVLYDFTFFLRTQDAFLVSFVTGHRNILEP